MFGIGTTELLIIAFIILVIFGAGKIPHIMGQLGRGIRDLKEGVEYDPNKELEEGGKTDGLEKEEK